MRDVISVSSAEVSDAKLLKMIKRAEVEDKAQPSVSHILEMLLRKGIRTYKAERKH